MRHALRRRSLTALWGVPVVLICLAVGGWLLALGAAVLSTIALWEFWSLGRTHGVAEALRWEVLLAAWAIVAGATLGPELFGAALDWGLLAIVVGAVIRASAQRDPGRGPGQVTASLWAILAVLYIPWLLGHLLLLRHAPAGPRGMARAIGTLVLVWLGDMAAFAVGATLGRHRLAAAVSPGKSVEGAVAGIGAAAIAAGAGAALLGVPWPEAVVVGAAVGAAGLVGDLFESLIKRGAAVKDSGTAVPGHGGVLDRFDSLLVAAPVAYWLLARVPWHALAAGLR